MSPDFQTTPSDTISIQFPAEGVSTTAKVTQLGERLFRLESIPVFAQSASFLDVIEADHVIGGGLRYLRVIEPSGWHIFDFLLSTEDRASEEIDRVLKRVEQLGGYCERAMGGCLFLCLPPEVAWDPTADVVG